MSIEEQVDTEVTDEEILASLEENPEEQPSEGEQPSLEDGFRFKSLEELMGHALKYNASGKEVEEPIETILKRASQGYHYAQEMGKLNSEKTEWQQKVEAAEAIKAKYSEIDQYAQENPEWFDHWKTAYDRRNESYGNDQTQGQQQSAFDPEQISRLIDERLGPIKETFQQQQQRIEQEKVEEENALLDNQIDATRKEFSEVDFSATDPDTGLSLEHRVYQFMVDQGIQDFNKAYKMMDYDNIMSRREERARTELAKNQQKSRKQGIVGEGSTPNTPQASELRKMNHDQEMAAMQQFLQHGMK